MDMQAPAKVGGLVILFAAMGTGALALLGKGIFEKRTTVYRVVFSDAGGLAPGSRVTLSGVLVGRVDKMALEGPNKAVATISVDEKTLIPTGSQALLPASLISIGDLEVRLQPGSGTPLQEGAEIPGRVTSPLESLMPESGKTLAKLDETLASLNKLLNDKELKGSITGLAASGQKALDAGTQTATNVGKLVNRMDGLVQGSQGEFKQILASTKRTMGQVEGLVGEFNRIAKKGELEKETVALLAELKAAAQKGNELVAEMTKIAADPELRASMKTTLDNAATMSESGTKIAKNVEEISTTGIEASKNANELMKKANVLADDLAKLMESFKKTFEKVGGGAASTLNQVKFEADLQASTDSGNIRTDLNAIIPLGNERLRLGMFDAFESNRFNLQLQKPLAEGLDFRYGVYASKLGVGVDYLLAPSWKLRGDLFGLNDPRLDLRLRYDFSGNLYGWVGLDRALTSNVPVMGVGIRR